MALALGCSCGRKYKCRDSPTAEEVRLQSSHISASHGECQCAVTASPIGIAEEELRLQE
jgi:hypothetical protein